MPRLDFKWTDPYDDYDSDWDNENDNGNTDNYLINDHQRFIDFADAVLDRRRGAAIRRLRVRVWEFSKLPESQAPAWLQRALQLNVEELVVEMQYCNDEASRYLIHFHPNHVISTMFF
jgi:hypothetical protein